MARTRSLSLPPTLERTRDSWHRLAEHVVSPARHAVTGRIGLRPAPGGFRTPPFGDRDRVVAVDGAELVLRERDAGQRRAPVSTVRAGAAFVGVDPGAPAEVYTPSTPLDLDGPLDVDPQAAALLAGWYALGAEALGRLAAEIADEQPSEAQIWPEHFDLGIAAGTVNYGASPGDAEYPLPYLYVGPHGGPPAEPPDRDAFWNAPFGAVRTILDIASADDALAFLRTGHDKAAGL